MGPTLETIFGGMKDLTLGQECARAVLISFYGLGMLRLSGRRTFAQMSAIDLVISIVVGSNLSRAMTGGVPFWGTLASVIVLVVLVMGMPVIVLERLVRVQVLVAFAEMQPDTDSHQCRGSGDGQRHRRAKGNREQRAEEGSDGEIGAGARCAKVAERDNEERQADAIGKEAEDERAG